jgi:hypothetical protein
MSNDERRHPKSVAQLIRRINSKTITEQIVNDLVSDAVTTSETAPPTEKSHDLFEDLFDDYNPNATDTSCATADTTADSFADADSSFDSTSRNQAYRLRSVSLFHNSETDSEPSTMADPDPDIVDAMYLDPDEPIPTLDACPYDDLAEHDGPHVTIREQNIEKYKMLYDQYVNFKGTIEASETVPPADRSDAQNDTIQALRIRILNIRKQLNPLAAKIEHIRTVQNTLKPTLPLPQNKEDSDPVFKLDLKEVRDFCGDTQRVQDPEQRLLETWTKLCTYANMLGMGYEKFKTCLFGLLHSEHFDYIRNYPDTTLPKLAVMLASRFVTESRFNDAVQDLDHFERKKEEPLRFAIARLRTSLEKASVIWPSNQRETIKDVELRKTLRQIVSDKARKLIDKHSIEARQQGIPLSLDRMIRLSEEEEKRSGPFQNSKSYPVSLYNTTLAPTAADPISNKLDNLTNMLIDMNVQQAESQDRIQELAADAECHAATRAMTRNAPRQNSRPYSLERAAAAIAPKHAYIAPSSSNVSYPPSTAPATKRPDTPYATSSTDANMSQSRSDSSQRRQSQYKSTDRSSRDRDRSRSDTRDRRQSSRDRTFDRSRSRDPQDRRSRTPTNNRESSIPRSYANNYSQDYSRGRNYNDSGYRNDYASRASDNRSLSRNRDRSPVDPRSLRAKEEWREGGNKRQDRNNYYQDNRWSKYDNNRGNYNNSNYQRYGNRNSNNYSNSSNQNQQYDRNRSNSRGRFQSTPVVNANDESVVNVGVSKNTGICHLCRSTIEHSIKDCYVIRAALQPENK